jgi:hypothetical protein
VAINHTPPRDFRQAESGTIAPRTTSASMGIDPLHYSRRIVALNGTRHTRSAPPSRGPTAEPPHNKRPHVRRGLMVKFLRQHQCHQSLVGRRSRDVECRELSSPNAAELRVDCGVPIGSRIGGRRGLRPSAIPALANTPIAAEGYLRVESATSRRRYCADPHRYSPPRCGRL